MYNKKYYIFSFYNHANFVHFSAIENKYHFNIYFKHINLSATHKGQRALPTNFFVTKQFQVTMATNLSLLPLTGGSFRLVACTTHGCHGNVLLQVLGNQHLQHLLPLAVDDVIFLANGDVITLLLTFRLFSFLFRLVGFLLGRRGYHH